MTSLDDKITCESFRLIPLAISIDIMDVSWFELHGWWTSIYWWYQLSEHHSYPGRSTRFSFWWIEQSLHHLDQAVHQWLFSSLRRFMSTINKNDVKVSACESTRLCDASSGRSRHINNDRHPIWLMFQSTHLLEFNDVLDYCRTNKIQTGSQCPTNSSISQHQSVW